MKQIIFWISFIVLFIISGIIILSKPLTFDESFNLQVVTQIKQNHIYQTSYDGGKVADPYISSGFPLHYLMSIFPLSGDSTIAIRIFCLILYLTLLMIIFFYKKNIIIPLFLESLFLSSPTFRNLCCSYQGEILATILFVLCLILKDKKVNFFIFSFVASLVISTKLIFALLVISILPRQKKYYFTTLASLITSNLIIFIFSYLQKMGSLSGIYQYFCSYSWQYFDVVISASHFFNPGFRLENFLPNTDNLSFIMLFLVVFFCVDKKDNLFPIIGSIYVFLKNFLRHSMSLLFNLLLITKVKDKYLLLLIVLNIIIANPLVGVPNIINDNHQKTAQIKRVSDFVKNISGTIYTNEWWQLPEVSYLSQKQFFDLTKTSMALSPNPYLLFSKLQSNDFPHTDYTQVCSQLVYCDNYYYLCKIDKDKTTNSLKSSANRYPETCSIN